MGAPVLPLTGTTALFAGVAGGMVAFNILVLLQFFPRGRRGTPTLSRASLVGFVLVSSWLFWLTLLYDAVTANSDAGATAVLFGVQIMMMAPFVWAFVTILRGHEHHVDPGGLAWPSFLALVMLGNELFMGAVYVAFVGGPAALDPGGPWGVAQAFAASSLSVWFFWAMFANMIALLFWVPLARLERLALFGLASSALVGPWIDTAPVVAGGLMGALMTATFGAALVELRRASDLPDTRGIRALQGVAAAFLVMAAGVIALFAFPTAPWSLLPFSLAMVLVMGVEMGVLARRVLQVLSAAPVADGPEVPPSAPSASPEGRARGPSSAE